MQQLQQDFGAWSLANIIHACYYLDSKHTMQQLLPLFLQPDTLNDANTQAIANVLWASAKAGLVLQDSQLQQLLARLLAQLHKANPQDLANCIYAFAVMGKQLSKEQLQQLLGEFSTKINLAKVQEVGNILWAVADLEQHISEDHLQLLESAIAHRLHAATPQNVSNSLWACAQLRFMPSQLLKALEQQPEQLQRLLHDASPQHLFNMALACAWLDFGHPFLFDAVLQQATTLLQQARRTEVNVHTFATCPGQQQYSTSSSTLTRCCCWCGHAAACGKTQLIKTGNNCTRFTCGCRTINCQQGPVSRA